MLNRYVIVCWKCAELWTVLRKVDARMLVHMHARSIHRRRVVSLCWWLQVFNIEDMQHGHPPAQNIDTTESES